MDSRHGGQCLTYPTDLHRVGARRAPIVDPFMFGGRGGTPRLRRERPIDFTQDYYYFQHGSREEILQYCKNVGFALDLP